MDPNDEVVLSFLNLILLKDIFKPAGVIQIIGEFSFRDQNSRTLNHLNIWVLRTQF